MKTYEVYFEVFGKRMVKKVEAYDTAHARFLVEEDAKKTFIINEIKQWVEPKPKPKPKSKYWEDKDLEDFGSIIGIKF